MRHRAFTFLTVLGVAAGISTAAAVLHARETGYPEPPLTERLLYLRSGNVADRLMLSFDAVAADIYWIRAIQHYGRDVKTPRPDSFSLLDPLLDLTTTLDPHFNIAYRFGSVFLAMEPPHGPGRVDLAVALLEKGLAASPDRWQYAYDLGFLHYWHTGDFSQAAEWLRKASAMRGAPEWIEPFVAITLLQAGNRADAARLLSELLESPEAYIRGAAERGLAQLRALEVIDQLQVLVEAYAAREGRYPGSLAALPEFGGGIPVDVTGTPFVLDETTRQVTIGPGSSLAPLPKAMRRQ